MCGILGVVSRTPVNQLLYDGLLLLQHQVQAVTHHSPMDWEKVRNMLRTLGREDIYGALTENGEIVIRDDLANHEYRFDKAAIDALFSNVPDTPSSIH